jgi:hypothetical protein
MPLPPADSERERAAPSAGTVMLSQLISHLQGIYAEHGDMPITRFEVLGSGSFDMGHLPRMNIHSRESMEFWASYGRSEVAPYSKHVCF